MAVLRTKKIESCCEKITTVKNRSTKFLENLVLCVKVSGGKRLKIHPAGMQYFYFLSIREKASVVIQFLLLLNATSLWARPAAY